ncbi:MAG: ammonium transporter [Pseudomonadota bacterium]
MKKLIFATAVLAAIPTLGLAQETGISGEATFVFNSLLLLVGGLLVFLMHVGFAMLEGGLVQEKNLTTQMIKNFGLFLVSMVCYFLIGYNLMYPLGDWVLEGYLSANWIWASVEPVAATAGDVDIFYATTGSDFFFQIMFCAAAATIVSGTIAERMRVGPFLIFVVVLAAFIYPIQGSWKWGGGFLDAAGFLDFAGSTIVHSVGGWAALTAAIILGPRLGKYNADGTINPIKGYSVPLATLGGFLLWIGWFGFNGASQLALGSVADVADVSRIFVNTNAAAIGGGLVAFLLTTLVYKKMSLPMILNGSLGGLVAITAEPLFPSMMLATLIGGLGGAIVVFGVDLLDRLRIDDVVSAIPVHLFAGVFGTLVVPLSNGAASFGAQLLGVGVYAASTVILTALTWVLINIFIGLRVSEDVEVSGMDSVLGDQN